MACLADEDVSGRQATKQGEFFACALSIANTKLCDRRSSEPVNDDASLSLGRAFDSPPVGTPPTPPSLGTMIPRVPDSVHVPGLQMNDVFVQQLERGTSPPPQQAQARVVAVEGMFVDLAFFSF